VLFFGKDKPEERQETEKSQKTEAADCPIRSDKGHQNQKRRKTQG
jgi:hypothetical protein